MLGLDWQWLWSTTAREHFMPKHTILCCEGQPSLFWSNKSTKKTVKMCTIFMPRPVKTMSIKMETTCLRYNCLSLQRASFFCIKNLWQASRGLGDMPKSRLTGSLQSNWKPFVPHKLRDLSSPEWHCESTDYRLKATSLIRLQSWGCRCAMPHLSNSSI